MILRRLRGSEQRFVGQGSSRIHRLMMSVEVSIYGDQEAKETAIRHFRITHLLRQFCRNSFRGSIFCSNPSLKE
jgi:hypothetical protein